MPLANDLFKIDVIGSISWSMLDFKIEVGMLLGPADLETEQISDIYLLTSSCVQGLRTIS